MYKTHKLSDSHSNLLPTPEVEVARSVVTANGSIKSQMIVKKASHNMRNAAISIVLLRSSSFRVQPLNVNRQQIRNLIVGPSLGCCRVVSIY